MFSVYNSYEDICLSRLYSSPDFLWKYIEGDLKAGE
jgi:hypothetical protein